jgi:hypothetical protein
MGYLVECEHSQESVTAPAGLDASSSVMIHGPNGARHKLRDLSPGGEAGFSLALALAVCMAL